MACDQPKLSNFQPQRKHDTAHSMQWVETKTWLIADIFYSYNLTNSLVVTVVEKKSKLLQYSSGNRVDSVV